MEDVRLQSDGGTYGVGDMEIKGPSEPLDARRTEDSTFIVEVSTLNLTLRSQI